MMYLPTEYRSTSSPGFFFITLVLYISHIAPSKQSHQGTGPNYAPFPQLLQMLSEVGRLRVSMVRLSAVIWATMAIS